MGSPRLGVLHVLYLGFRATGFEVLKLCTPVLGTQGYTPKP